MRFLGLGIVVTRLRILVLDLALLTVNLIGPVDSLVKTELTPGVSRPRRNLCQSCLRRLVTYTACIPNL